MADITIDDAILDTSVSGGEMIPESDGGTGKKVSIGSIKDYVLAQLSVAETASAASIATDGVYVCQSNVIKRMTGTMLANAIVDWALSLTGIVTPNGNEKFVVDDAGTKKTITLSGVRDYVNSNLTSLFNGLSSSLPLGASDYFIVKQGNDVRKGTLGALASFAIGTFASYVVGLDPASSISDTDLFSIVSGSVTKKVTGLQLRSYLNASGSVTCDVSTTSGRIPCWSSTDKKLTDGYSVSTSIGSTGGSGSIPTEEAVRLAISDISVSDKATAPATTTENKIPKWSSVQKTLSDGFSVVTTVDNVGSDSALATEKAIRTALNLTGDVKGPISTTAENIPQWDSVQKKLKDGLSLSTSIGATGSDLKVPTEKAVRSAISALTYVDCPAATTAENIPQWDSVQKKLKDGLSLSTSIGATGSDLKVPTEKAVRSAISALTYVDGPAATTQGCIPRWSGTNRVLDGGMTLTTTIGTVGSDSALASEKAVRTAITTADNAIITLVGTKANTSDMTTALALKANAADLTSLASTVATKGDVNGPISTTEGKIPKWGNVSKTLTDGYSVVTEIGATGANTAVVTEKAVRDAITDAMGVGAPVSHSAGNIPSWNVTDSLTDGYSVRTTIRSTAQASDTSLPTEKAVRTAVNGCITAPISHNENAIPQWGAANELKAGKSIVTVVGSTGSDENIPTEKAVRDALPVLATTAADGLMSASDKTKLNNLVDTSSVAEIGQSLSDNDTVVIRQGDVLNKKTLLSRFWTYIMGKLPTFAVDSFAVPTDNTNGNASTTAHGFCPKLSGDSTQFLRGDGSFATPAGSDDFTGTDGTAAGVHGLVPAPATTDVGKFLNASGVWMTPPSAAGVDIPGATAIDALASADLGYFFDSSANSYRKVTAQQILDFIGGAKRYDTIFVPAGAMTPSNVNGATPGAITFENTTHDTQAFTNTKDTSVEFSVVFPDDWDKLSVKFKALWTVYDSTSSETGQHVCFNVGGISCADGETITVAPTAANMVSLLDQVDSANELHKTSASTAHTFDGTVADGNLVHLKVTRDADYAPTGGTPMPTEALLLGIVIQFGRTNSYSAW